MPHHLSYERTLLGIEKAAKVSTKVLDGALLGPAASMKLTNGLEHRLSAPRMSICEESAATTNINADC